VTNTDYNLPYTNSRINPAIIILRREKSAPTAYSV